MNPFGRAARPIAQNDPTAASKITLFIVTQFYRVSRPFTPKNRRQHANRYDIPVKPWLARFSFSFLIIAMVLGWEVYKGLRDNTLSTPRAVLYLLCGGISVGLSMMGIRERHKPQG